MRERRSDFCFVPFLRRICRLYFENLLIFDRKKTKELLLASLDDSASFAILLDSSRFPSSRHFLFCFAKSEGKMCNNLTDEHTNNGRRATCRHPTDFFAIVLTYKNIIISKTLYDYPIDIF